MGPIESPNTGGEGSGKRAQLTIDALPPLSLGSQCPKLTDPAHIRKYTHALTCLPAVSVKPIMMKPNYQGGVTGPGAQAKAAAARTPWFYNTHHMGSAALKFLQQKSSNKFSTSSQRFREIVQHLQRWTLVHRCDQNKLESMLRTGQMMSRQAMTAATDEPNLVNSGLARYPFSDWAQRNAKAAEEFVRACTHAAVLEWHSQHHDASAAPESLQSKKVTPEQLRTAEEAVTNKLGLVRPMLQEVKSSPEEARQIVLAIVHGALEGALRPQGIGYQGDVEMGTDSTVFSVLGPHLYNGYGKIVLVMSHSIVRHPETFVLPCAATFFRGGAYGNASYRPWVDPAADTNGAMEHYIKSQLHAAIQGTDEKDANFARTVALELLGKFIADNKGKDPCDVTYLELLEWYKRSRPRPDPVISPPRVG